MNLPIKIKKEEPAEDYFNISTSENETITGTFHDKYLENRILSVTSHIIRL